MFKYDFIPCLDGSMVKYQAPSGWILSFVYRINAGYVIGLVREGGDDFWQNKSLERLAAEQDVKPIGRLEDVLGKGAELWEDEEK
jgi:hypothetical protein